MHYVDKKHNPGSAAFLFKDVFAVSNEWDINVIFRRHDWENDCEI